MITALAKMSTVIRRQCLLYEFSIVRLMLQDKSQFIKIAVLVLSFKHTFTAPQLSKRLEYMLVA